MLPLSTLPLLLSLASQSGGSNQASVSLLALKSFLNITSTTLSKSESSHTPIISSLLQLTGQESTFFIKCALALCSLLYASNYMFTKDLQTTMAPSMIAFIRFFIASICFIPHMLSYHGNIGAIIGAIELGFWCGLGFIAQAYSLQYNSTGKVAFFCGLGVIMPPIFTYFSNKLCVPSITPDIRQYVTTSSKQHSKVVPKNRNKLVNNIKHIIHEISLLLPLPSLIALIGGAVLEVGGLEAPKWLDLSLLLTPFAFSMCFWRSDQHIKKYPQDSIIVTGTLLSTTAIMCFVWTLVSNAFPLSPHKAIKLIQSIYNSKKVLYGFLYTGIISTAITSIIEQWAMKVVSASQITLIYTLEPIFATIFGVIYLNEHLTRYTVVGAILIVLACVADSISSEVPLIDNSNKNDEVSKNACNSKSSVALMKGNVKRTGLNKNF